MSQRTEDGLPLAPPLPPGWYDDPVGRHDLRYHNGFVWTGDVSTAGERFVDPYRRQGPTSPEPVVPSTGSAPTNPIATAALVVGILSICTAWMPYVVVVGAVLAVLAVVFGVVGRRRAIDRGTDQGRAVVGIVTGTIGVACAVVGVIFTVALARALDRFDDPARSEVELTSCETSPTGDGEARTWRATGEITNVDDHPAEFSVKVIVREISSRGPEVAELEEIGRIEPGETAPFDVTGLRMIRFEPECRVAVYGPLPFGIDLSD